MICLKQCIIQMKRTCKHVKCYSQHEIYIYIYMVYREAPAGRPVTTNY